MATPEFESWPVNTVEAILLIAPDGSITDASQSACDLLGYSIDELKGLRTAQLISSPDHQAFDCQTSPECDRTSSIWMIRKKDGSELEISSTCARLSTGHCVGVIYDRTLQRKTEESLRSTLGWFQLVVEQVPAILWTTDKELRITSGTGSALQDLNINTDQSFGKTLLFHLGTDSTDIEPVQAHLRALEGQSSIYELNWLDRNFTVCVKPFRNSENEIIGVIGLAQDITPQKRAELQLREAKTDLQNQVLARTEELQKTNEQLRSEMVQHKQTAINLRNEQELLRGMLAIHERDRQILAYEIHDGLVQYITAGLMQLEAHQAAPTTGAAIEQNNFGAALELLRKAVSEARRLISGLRPPILDESGLSVALEYLASEHRQSTSMQVETLLRLSDEPLVDHLETALFRIAQEALTNIRRHSKSKKARIELTEEDGWITLTVQDWGIGFDPDHISRSSFGLQGVKERTRLLDGHFTLQTGPGQGTRIQVKLPRAQRTLPEEEYVSSEPQSETSQPA